MLGGVRFDILLLVATSCSLLLLRRLLALLCRGRQRDEAKQPLLRPDRAAGAAEWDSGGVVRIGIPARDFVRIKSAPQACDDPSRRKCVACGEVGMCISLRPCGCVVLCRACSDFVCTCPRCGAHISGVGLRSVGD
jgi:hypothetical protein